MDRPDLLGSARELLTPIERLQLSAIRRTFDSRPLSTALRFLQYSIGTRWISSTTSKLRHVHHFERVPKFGPDDSFVLVCNHRSFFDLYIVATELMVRGTSQRIVFPVRSKFFYDNPLGFVVNGAMSFFAMYPPIFRDRQRATLNMLGLDELAWLLQQGGYMVGFHPEGTRNTGDPYQLLPARTGVGRLIYHSKVRVLPVFINGLLSDNLPKQVRSNYDGTGVPVHTVFGKPLDFGPLLEEPASQSVYKRIANATRDALMQLGEEERAIRSDHAG